MSYRQLARWETSAFPWSAKAMEILKSYSADYTFRPCQQAAINLAQQGYSLFLQLPTGAGKSLCFQVPSLLERNKLTLVISPLRSLLDDQKQNLVRAGLGDKAVFLSPGNVPTTCHEAAAFMYTTPEMILQNPRAAELVEHLNASERLARVVVDEAHCVLEWGNTFRPSYLEFAKYRKQHLPHVPVTFLTATASPQVVSTTAMLFGLEPIDVPDPESPPLDAASSMVAIQQVFDRPNLKLVVRPKTKAVVADMANLLKAREPAIVYVLSQKEAEQVAKELSAFGIDAQPYHAGLSDSLRKRTQYMWMSGKTSVICATVAFGMGIDRSDVRHVIHHSIPLSLSAYMQQIVRMTSSHALLSVFCRAEQVLVHWNHAFIDCIGRDGQPATCTLFYSAADQMKAQYIGSGGDGFVDASTAHGIRDVVDLVMSKDCRRSMLHHHFGYAFDVCCNNCNCGQFIPQDEDVERKTIKKPSKDYGVEKLYVTIQQQAKRNGQPKSSILSRKTIEAILANPPDSIDQLAAMRGVGEDRAHAYYDLLMRHISQRRP